MGDGVTSGTRSGGVLLAGGVLAIGIAYAAAIVRGAAPAWAPWLLAFGAAATPVGLFVLGAETRGALSRGVAVLLGALFVVLFASFGAGLALPAGEGAAGRLLLGLPFRLAIVFYGVGFVPLVALPLAFAMTFNDRGPLPADAASTAGSGTRGP